MMLSFNFGVLKCDDAWQGEPIKAYLGEFLRHSAAAQVEDKQALSAFMGQDCRFGQSSTNAAWASIFESNGDSTYFMPAFTSDPTTLGDYIIQAEVNWGSAWPEGADPINLDRDSYFMSQLDPTHKEYVGTVSPLLASHLSSKVRLCLYHCNSFLAESG